MTRRIQTTTNGIFKRLIGGEQIGKAIRGEFNAIIVAMLPKVGRTYYEGKYDPDAKGTLPDCWSNDGIFPEAAATNIQARSCAKCPNNVDGSGDNGKGKACRFNRRVALMLDGDTEHHLYQLNIPAKSLFGKGAGNTHPFESYLKFLVANNTSPDYVVTNIAYDLDADTMQMVFTPVRPITAAELEAVSAAQCDPDTQRLIQITVGEADGGKPKQVEQQAPTPKKAATPPPEEPEEEAEEEEVVEEPVEEPAEEAAPAQAGKAPWLDDDDGDETAEEPAAKAAPAKKAPVRRTARPKPEAVPMKADLADIVSDWLTDAAEANA
jgi:hypothetical protein